MDSTDQAVVRWFAPVPCIKSSHAAAAFKSPASQTAFQSLWSTMKKFPVPPRFRLPAAESALVIVRSLLDCYSQDNPNADLSAFCPRIGNKTAQNGRTKKART